MQDANNIKALDALNIDYIGLIFYPPSPRNVTEENNIPETKAQKVGVFVNHPVADIVAKAEHFGFKAIQLHGNESPDTCKLLMQMGFTVLKAFRVNEQTQADEITPYQNTCTYFLYDTKSEKLGGTGQKFDWKKLNELNDLGPFIMSGGIDANDAKTINNLTLSNLKGLDLNSKFEIKPALKDIALLSGFIHNINSKTKIL